MTNQPSVPCPNMGRTCGCQTHFAGSQAFQDCQKAALSSLADSGRSLLGVPSAASAPVPAEDHDEYAEFNATAEQNLEQMVSQWQGKGYKRFSYFVNYDDEFSTDSIARLLGGELDQVDEDALSEYRSDTDREHCKEVWDEVKDPDDEREWSDVEWEVIGDSITEFVYDNTEDTLVQDMLRNSGYHDFGYNMDNKIGEQTASSMRAIDTFMEESEEDAELPLEMTRGFVEALVSESFTYTGDGGEEGRAAAIDRIANDLHERIKDSGIYSDGLDMIWTTRDIYEMVPTHAAQSTHISIEDPFMTIANGEFEFYSFDMEGFSLNIELPSCAEGIGARAPGDGKDYIRFAGDFSDGYNRSYIEDRHTRVNVVQ